MSDQSFFFKRPLGVLGGKISEVPTPCDTVPFIEPRMRIQMVQNGFKISFMDEDFVANNVDEMVKLVKDKFEEALTALKKKDK